MKPFKSTPAVSLVRRYGLAMLLGLGSPALAGAAPPVDASPSSASSAGAPRDSAASTPANRYELSYAAPKECPTREEFITWTDGFYAGTDATEAGTASSPEATWQARPEELSGSVQVKVQGDGAQYTAHLMMVNAGGFCPTVRPPHTETSCADAVKAMAYSLAQALKAPPCAEASNLPRMLCPPPAASRCARAPQACPRAKPCAPGEPPLRGELGLSAGVVTPLAEDIAWGGALLVGFTTPAGSPSGRIAVGYWDAGSVPVGHDLRAQLWSLGVSFCPVALRFTSWLTLPLCATGEVGPVALSGLGSAAADADSDPAASAGGEDRANLYLWSSLGVATRLRFESSWLFAELEPNLVFPLFYHPVYVHQPSSEASERQDAGQVGRWMALKAHLNVGVVFP
ncbi:MAG TPA: hypothetical protein VFU02_22410 [Polyangiaceae bacterium]|nr:hypothetical protein [Polyangiaceae bacterium]